MNLRSILLFVFVISSTFVYSQKNIHRENTEWANFWMTNVNDLDLPHILFIGNSITQRYAPVVAEKLKGKAYCSYLTTSKSLGDPLYLKEVELALSHNKYSIIHFNNGLHGFAYTDDEYINSFPKLFKLLKKYAPNAKLIWATITPIRDKKTLEISLDNERVIKRNELVLNYLKGKDVVINDLYTLMFKKTNFYTVGDGIHPNKDGVEFLSEKVMSKIVNFISE